MNDPLTSTSEDTSADIAIIGMDCQWPEADNPDAYWDLLRKGRCGIRRFETAQAGDDLVPARGLLAGAEAFDPAFFGLTPREAATTDPQQRRFFTCAWRALEHAGHAPDDGERSVGVFAGSGTSGYHERLSADPEWADSLGDLEILIGNDKDHLATRLAYLLNLRGPAVPIQTACSTSLVAVHMACQSLLNLECDLALAGGVSIPAHGLRGYHYQEGGILSPDGTCRPFAADARGTVPSSGVAAIVLRRLEDAQADGDHILAVIKGTAINNDGHAKVGYTAPSVEGQARVIEEALAVAGVDQGSIGYVEAHGTGTALGDPIEIEALGRVFRRGSAARGIGSVKGNIGHADAAAGLAGLIKTILCLQHRELVPSLFCDQPNPHIDWATCAFEVVRQTRPWPRDMPFAGVSSFGIGGTNAHVILGAPPSPAPHASSTGFSIATLSAKDETALQTLAGNWARRFHPDQPDADRLFPDAAYTSNLGRAAFPYRYAAACRNAADLHAALGKPLVPVKAPSASELCFLFTGQGGEAVDMGALLYRDAQTNASVFRDWIDHGAAHLKSALGCDLRRFLQAEDEETRTRLAQADLWQPAVFLVSLAMAEQMRAWGLRPDALMGHSLGEYAAATFAGVFDFEDMLDLVAMRGKACLALGGTMTAVWCDERRLRDLIDGLEDTRVSIAAHNGEALFSVSGMRAGIAALELELGKQSIHFKRLPATNGFHSAVMEPLLAPLTQRFAAMRRRPPQIPIVSNLTGDFHDAGQICDPAIWARHTREPVKFREGLARLSRQNTVFVEVGPGDGLARLAARHLGGTGCAIATLPRETAPNDGHGPLQALATAWAAGAAVDWEAFHEGNAHHRVPLPPYPLRETPHGIPLDEKPETPIAETSRSLTVKAPPNQWLYQPGWRQIPRRQRPLDAEELGSDPGPWLICADDGGWGAALARRIHLAGGIAVLVHRGPRFEVERPQDADAAICLPPNDPQAWTQLWQHLEEEKLVPRKGLFCWLLDETEELSGETIESFLKRTYAGVIRLATSLHERHESTPLRLTLLTQGLDNPDGASCPRPDQGLFHGLARVIPKELEQLTCGCLDLDPAWSPRHELGVTRVLSAVIGHAAEPRRALRGALLWQPESVAIEEPLPVDDQPFRSGSSWILVNGLTEFGLNLAERMMSGGVGTPIIIDRTFIPPRSEWEKWKRDPVYAETVGRILQRLSDMEHQGWVPRLLSCRPDNAAALARAMTPLTAEGISISGVIYLDRPVPSALIGGRSLEELTNGLTRKVTEVLAVRTAFQSVSRRVWFTENEAESCGIGQLDKAAGYGLIDALAPPAGDLEPAQDVVIDWSTFTWLEAEAAPQASPLADQLSEKRRLFGLDPDACWQVLKQVLQSGRPRVIVSTRPYQSLLAQQDQFTLSYFGVINGSVMHGKTEKRPPLETPYREPQNDTQRLIAETWERFLGFEGIGIDDNFFELGGHSLLAVQLIDKLNLLLSANITLQTLFDAPTVQRLAEHLGAEAQDGQEQSDLESLLSEIEGMSEEEVSAILAEDDHTAGN